MKINTKKKRYKKSIILILVFFRRDLSFAKFWEYLSISSVYIFDIPHLDIYFQARVRLQSQCIDTTINF